MHSLTAVLALCLTLLVVTSAAVLQKDDSVLVPDTQGLCKCGPDVYESRTVSVSGPSGKMLNGSYHIDVKNQRLALYHHAIIDGKVIAYHVIHRDNYFYAINPSLKACNKNSDPEPVSSCVSKDAKHVQSFNLGGAGGATIRVDGWTIPKTSLFRRFEYMFFSADKCVLTLVVGGDVREEMAFTDAKLGINDKSVFDLPPYCKKAVDEEAVPHLGHELFEAHQARKRIFQ